MPKQGSTLQLAKALRSRVRRWYCCHLLAGAVLLQGCVGTEDEQHWQRHFDGAVWVQALETQVARPQQIVPEVALLVAAPLVYQADARIQRWFNENTITGGGNTSGNMVEFGLLLAPAVWGLGDWIGGGDSRWFEVSAETIVVTGVIVESLKLAFPRDRPDGKDGSFPSGHAALSFASATLIGRRMEDDLGTPLGYLLYVPATFVAVNRVESNKHFASDVFAGAFLGLTLANLFYDAHYGEPGIFGKRARGWSVEPVVGEDFLGLSAGYRF